MVVLVDAELFVRDWLGIRFPDARLCTETPANLASVLPCIKVERIGGSDSENVRLDDAILDVEYFAATRDDARKGAEEVRYALRNEMPGDFISGAAVQYVRTSVAPSWAPYDNTSLRRFVATYLIRLHTV